MLADLLVIGVTQGKCQLLVGDDLIVRFRYFLPYDGCYLNALPGTIDASVGKQLGMRVVVSDVVIAVVAIAVDGRQAIVRRRIGKDT